MTNTNNTAETSTPLSPQFTLESLKSAMEQAGEIEKRHLENLKASFAGVRYMVADDFMPLFPPNEYMLIIGKKLAEKLGLVSVKVEAEVKEKV